MMKASVKRKWIAALRSGKYRQATDSLYDGSRGYCCLGVLCRIIDPKLKPRHLDGGVPRDIGVDDGLTQNQRDVLINMNDLEGNSFKEIATWVKKHVHVR